MVDSVAMPTRGPVIDVAPTPWAFKAMASKAIDTCSRWPAACPFPLGGGGGDGVGQTRQFIGGVAHGGDHHNRRAPPHGSVRCDQPPP